MPHALLALHLFITLALIVVILLQKSEGASLGASSNFSGLLSARGSKHFLSRITGILAALFIGMSLLLAVLSKQGKEAPSIVDDIVKGQTIPVVPAVPAPAANSAAQPITVPVEKESAPLNQVPAEQTQKPEAEKVPAVPLAQ